MGDLNLDLYDASVSHEIGLLQYDQTLIEQAVTLLNKTEDDLYSRLKARWGKIAEVGFDAGPELTEHMQAMLLEIRAANVEAYQALGKQLTDNMTQLSGYEQTFQNKTLGDIIGGVSSTRLSAEQVMTLVQFQPSEGRLFSNWMDSLEGQRYSVFRDEVQGAIQQVSMGMLEGDPLDTIVRRLRGTKENAYADGAMNISRTSAQAVVRTISNQVTTATREAVYANNSDLVEGVQIVATLDLRTTPECRALDGQVFPVGEGPRPPFHVNCRTTTAPVVKGDKSEGTRASKDGQVNGRESFDGWLRRQDESDPKAVESYLGPGRYQEFKDGRSMKGFVDISGQPLTLEQLADREKVPTGDITPTAAPSLSAEQVVGAVNRGEVVDIENMPSSLPEFGDPRFTMNTETDDEGLLGGATYRVREFATKINDELWEAYGPWREGLTTAEVDALNAYTGYDADETSGEINAALRSGSKPYPDTQRNISQVRSAVMKAEAPADMLTYRSVVTDDVKWRGFSEQAQRVYAALLPGDTFSDAGFMSTTGWGVNGVSSFNPSAGIQLKLEIPSGSKGIAFVQQEKPAAAIEVLVHDGAKWQVVSNQIVNGQRIITLLFVE